MHCVAGLCAILCGSVLAGPAAAQSVCVPDPVETSRLAGATIFEAGGKSAPLPDVTVSIAPYSWPNPAPLASFVTGRDGRFSISGAAPGRYWLSFRHTAVIGFGVELRLRPRGGRPSAFLIATFRNDPGKPCGGGSVRLSPAIEDGVGGASSAGNRRRP